MLMIDVVLTNYSSRLKERCPEGVYSFFVCPSVRLSVCPSVRNCHKNVRPIPNPRNMYMCVSCDRREHRIYFTSFRSYLRATEVSTDSRFRHCYFLFQRNPSYWYPATRPAAFHFLFVLFFIPTEIVIVFQMYDFYATIYAIYSVPLC